MKLRVLDLFSGIGGFSLGLERTGGFETVAFCEIDPFCRKVLAKHWPDVPCFEDVRTLRAEDVGPVDVICGGFPCQPFSTASRGRRVAQDMWPAMLRVIQEFDPVYVWLENVAEPPIAKALKEIGRAHFYRRISGDDIGADHTRARWWGCSHPDDEGELRRAVDAEVAKLPSLCRGFWGAENYARAVRVSDAVPDRVHRLRALGNTIFPVIPEAFGRAVLSVQRPDFMEAAE